MKIKLITALFLLMSFSKAKAQEFKLGKVTVAELQEKVYAIDTTAAAAVLYNAARTFFTYNATNGFCINTENSFRIKIYKKEGLKWANFKKAYYIGYENINEDMIEFTDCITYNLEDGKIIKTKLNSEGVFKTKINKNWKEATITMPNVKVGSVIEFKYELKSQNTSNFPVFNFQQDIPVKKAQYVTEIPGFFVYKAIAKRPSELKLESKIARGSLNFASKLDPMRSEIVDFEQVNNTFTALNIPALKEEPYVGNIENYRISIQHELEKTQFYGEPVKDYSLTWEGVAKIIYEHDNFGKELKKKEYLINDVEQILSAAKTEDEKLDIIFKFVQNRMNWDGKYGYYAEKNIEKTYLEKTANAASINFILIAMLKQAGISANPVLLSTIDNGIPICPNRTFFNYVIAAAEIDGKQILLDAANKNTTRNILPIFALNWTGRLIREDKTSEEIKLVPTIQSLKATNVIVAIDENGKLSGQYRVMRNNYETFTFKEKNKENQQNYLEKVENKVSGLQITNYSIQNTPDTTKPMMESFTFTADNQCEIIGDKMYISPELFFAQPKNPFVQENREYPIYFGYPKQEKLNINITIPKGYVVESLPKPINLQTTERVFLFKFNVDSVNNSIQIMINEEHNLDVVSSSFYPVLKDFFRQMTDKQNEKIVLKKM
ncbi:MAG: hypothetical protein QG594_572 [Bacteroidota bacterium]|nr:hypothetical protein [Bacteroidota bacterium]